MFVMQSGWSTIANIQFFSNVNFKHSTKYNYTFAHPSALGVHYISYFVCNHILHSDRNHYLLLEQLAALPKRNIQETPSHSEGNLDFNSKKHKLPGH
jgi:hypothetical protein